MRVIWASVTILLAELALHCQSCCVSIALEDSSNVTDPVFKRWTDLFYKTTFGYVTIGKPQDMMSVLTFSSTVDLKYQAKGELSVYDAADTIRKLPYSRTRNNGSDMANAIEAMRAQLADCNPAISTMTGFLFVAGKPADIDDVSEAIKDFKADGNELGVLDLNGDTSQLKPLTRYFIPDTISVTNQLVISYNFCRG